MKFISFSLVLCLFLLPKAAFTQDEALYDPAISSDMVYVRTVNTTNTEIKPAINGKTYPNLELGQVSPYYPLNILTIKIAPNFSELLESGSFYTLVLNKEIWLNKDFKSDDRSKAVLAFYNLSDQDDILLKANSTIPIFENIESQSHQARTINEAKIDLAVSKHNQDLAKLNDVIIERRNHYSIFFNGQTIKIVKASIDHTQ